MVESLSALKTIKVSRCANIILATGIQTERHHWGRPTLVVKDLDANELFFWLPHDDWTGFEMSAAYAG
jgi:hypothetical protein